MCWQRWSPRLAWCEGKILEMLLTKNATLWRAPLRGGRHNGRYEERDLWLSKPPACFPYVATAACTIATTTIPAIAAATTTTAAATTTTATTSTTPTTTTTPTTATTTTTTTTTYTT